MIDGVLFILKIVHHSGSTVPVDNKPNYTPGIIPRDRSTAKKQIMTLFQIIFSVLGALFVGTLFYYIFKFAGPWGNIWLFFLVLILAGIAAAAWVEPVGPIYRNIAWLPILFVIVTFAVFLAAVTPPNQPGEIGAGEKSAASKDKNVSLVVLSGFFWVFLILLMFAAIYGVFR